MKAALEDAEKILVERGAQYADIWDNSKVFAALMRALGVQTPASMTDVEFHCLANICTKLARSTTSSTHEDNWVDLSNYGLLQLADLRRNKQIELAKKETYQIDTEEIATEAARFAGAINATRYVSPSKRAK